MKTQTSPTESTASFATPFVVPGGQGPKAADEAAGHPVEPGHGGASPDPASTSRDETPGMRPPRPGWRDRLTRRPWAVAVVAAVLAATVAGGAGYAAGHEVGESSVVLPDTGRLPDGEVPAEGRPAVPGGGIGPGGGGLPGLDGGQDAGSATDDAAASET